MNHAGRNTAVTDLGLPPHLFQDPEVLHEQGLSIPHMTLLQVVDQQYLQAMDVT
jgi:hypothetical protein